MNILFSLFLFLIIIIFYLNIMKQLKTGEDLVIYEMDYSTNQNLQEICDMNQPVSFQFQEYIPDIQKELFNEYESFDINVKDTNDYLLEPVDINTISLPLKKYRLLIDSSSGSHYISENNESFLRETGIVKQFRVFDEYMKPNYTVQTKYDYIIGAKGATTVFKYHTNYRQFLYVISGKIRVKMTSWDHSKLLYPYKDYENYEFRSPINIIHPQEKYNNYVDKIKTIDFEVQQGYALYLPPYWWYSLEFIEESTELSMITYNSLMNQFINISNIVLYYVQQQNITKQKIPRKIEIPEETKDNDDNIDN